MITFDERLTLHQFQSRSRKRPSRCFKTSSVTVQIKPVTDTALSLITCCFILTKLPLPPIA